MNHEALLILISNLTEQNLALQAQVAELMRQVEAMKESGK